MNLKIYDRNINMKVDTFSSFRLTLRYDSVASDYDLSFYFDPNNADHKKIAAPTQYNLVKIEHKGQLLFTGFIINQAFTSEATKPLASIGGYSVAGVLEDCQIPVSAYPLQSDGLTLKQIAEKYLKPFQIPFTIDDSASDQTNEVYLGKASKKKTVKAKMAEKLKKTTADANRSVKEYLTEIATQKNIVISHDEKGYVLFTTAKTNQKPFFHFENNTVGTSFKLSFNGQGIHSHITVMKQADIDGGNASEVTIQNPFVPRGTNSYRPRVAIQSSGTDVDTTETANQILLAELKNIVVTIDTDRWEIDGKLIKPNMIITLTNPDIYIYKKTKFFVEAVSYTGDSEKQNCTLTCVLPCIYDGSDPVNIFL